MRRLAEVRRTAFDEVVAEIPTYREPWRCGLVRRPDAAAVLPFDVTQGVYVLARQPRIGRLGGETVEVPAGVFDDPSHDPLETAQRELAEEMGLDARYWVTVASGVYVSPGYSDERMHLFLAEGLTVTQSRPEDGYITQVRYPLDGIDEHVDVYRSSAEADLKTLLLLQALQAALVSGGVR